MQENLLFRFREKQILSSNSDSDSKFHYNLIKGIWENECGYPIIINRIKNDLPTTKTATREGSDQSESLQFGPTSITKTRESIDQTELSDFGGTNITETQEGVDRTEISGFDLYLKNNIL
jgi:hypothetical protein